MLNPALQLPGLRALLNHAGATLPILGLEIRRKTRRDERTGTIWDGQPFQEVLQRKLLLLEERHMFLQRHCEVLTRTLGQGLCVITANGLF